MEEKVVSMYKVRIEDSFEKMLRIIRRNNSYIDYIEINPLMLEYLRTFEKFTNFKYEDIYSIYGVKVVTNNELKDIYCKVHGRIKQ